VRGSNKRMESRIYVLECAEGRYYVDQLCLFVEIPNEDVINYFRHNRCEWTRKYVPIRVFQIIKNTTLSLDLVTKVCMHHFGIHAVRGGCYSQIELSHQEVQCIQRESVEPSQKLQTKRHTTHTPGSRNSLTSSSTVTSPLPKSDLSDIKFVLDSMDSEEIQLSFKRKGEEVMIEVNHETQSEPLSSPTTYKCTNKRLRTIYDTSPLIAPPTSTTSLPRSPFQPRSISSGSSPAGGNIFLPRMNNPRYHFELFPNTSISKSLPRDPLPSYASTSSKY
jgi:hypothetical protein